MAEAFKNLLNQEIIHAMAGHFQKHWARFDARGFEAAAAKNLDTLELKARTGQIADAMIKYLPVDFRKAGKIILASLGTPLGENLSAGRVNARGIAGWAVMPMTHYVGLHGHDHFDLSMTLFKEMTKRASSEFGIRFFLLKSPTKTLGVLRTWTTDKNQHVRRLVSEGIRPRLPWGMRLPVFINDPMPVINLLERLKDDDEEYVRRSVANNLNDIAKDHPDLVAKIAARWIKGASRERRKLIRHACRTLIKNGHKKTLAVLGFQPPEIKRARIGITTPQVLFGNTLQFTLSLVSDFSQDQILNIDYIIHHQKANGSTSPKVFKWRTLSLPAKQKLTLSKKHAIRKITTRVYYPGLHTLELVVNGVSVGKGNFELLIP